MNTRVGNVLGRFELGPVVLVPNTIGCRDTFGAPLAAARCDCLVGP
jgi:hypothetical protein